VVDEEEEKGEEGEEERVAKRWRWRWMDMIEVEKDDQSGCAARNYYGERFATRCCEWDEWGEANEEWKGVGRQRHCRQAAVEHTIGVMPPGSRKASIC
jgi:hypothetical protein